MLKKSRGKISYDFSETLNRNDPAIGVKFSVTV